MAGAGYRTFQSGEVLTSNNVQTYLMDQAVQVYSGTAARASAVPSPSTGMVAYATATGLQVFNGSAWVSVGGTGYGAATGGQSTATATISGVNYTILTFTATGTLTNTTAGFFDYIAVGGGSGCLSRSATASGGGGAGQVVIGSLYLSANQTITIGAGSSFADSLAGGSPRFIQATNTTIAATAPFAVTALGALQSHQQDNMYGYVGGGNGQMAGGSANLAVTENTALGYRGGDSGTTSGGGGGGSTARGSNGVTSTGGAAGAGFDVSVFVGGSEVRKGMGGGGGGTGAGGAAATGGVAGSTGTTPSNGNANSGGGAGGGVGTVTTGIGGSGIVYIRFRT